jgi:hypothetical protein
MTYHNRLHVCLNICHDREIVFLTADTLPCPYRGLHLDPRGDRLRCVLSAQGVSEGKVEKAFGFDRQKRWVCAGLKHMVLLSALLAGSGVHARIEC